MSHLRVRAFDSESDYVYWGGDSMKRRTAPSSENGRGAKLLGEEDNLDGPS